MNWLERLVINWLNRRGFIVIEREEVKVWKIANGET